METTQLAAVQYSTQTPVRIATYIIRRCVYRLEARPVIGFQNSVIYENINKYRDEHMLFSLQRRRLRSAVDAYYIVPIQDHGLMPACLHANFT